MTTDTQLAPTDDEIDALIDQHRWDATTGRRAIARAVLARWGAQPTTSSAAEFALQALVAAGHVSQELVDKAMALPGAPQPAHSGEPVYAFRRRGQDDFCTCTFKRYTELSDFPEKFEMRIFYTAQPVEREPLTDLEIESATGAKIGTPLFLVAKGFVQATESAHGIKGGQHGAE